MTKLLAQAFEKASELPDHLQDELARALLEELAGEAQWDQTLAQSADTVDRMAEQAVREYRAGHTKEMGFDELRNPTSQRVSSPLSSVCQADSAECSPELSALETESHSPQPSVQESRQEARGLFRARRYWPARLGCLRAGYDGVVLDRLPCGI
jgi:hypothetical protein